MDNPPVPRSSKGVGLLRHRGYPHAALGLADRLELGPGSPIRQRLEREGRALARFGLATNLQRHTRKRCGSPAKIFRRVWPIAQPKIGTARGRERGWQYGA